MLKFNAAAVPRGFVMIVDKTGDLESGFASDRHRLASTWHEDVDSVETLFSMGVDTRAIGGSVTATQTDDSTFVFTGGSVWMAERGVVVIECKNTSMITVTLQ